MPHPRTKMNIGAKMQLSPHGSEGGIHGLHRAVGGAQQGVEAEVEVCHDIARQNDGHEVVCKRQGGIARAEKPQDGRQAELQNESQSDAHHDVHDEHVAEDFLSGGIILLSQPHRHQCGRTDADHRAEGSGERHDGRRQGQSHNRLLANTLADEDAVDDVVYGGGRHRHNGRDGVLHEQFAHGLFPQYIEFFCLIHNAYLFRCKVTKICRCSEKSRREICGER